MKRKGLSKKTRFEVFKRDSFTCQYCGQKSPEVVLRVDHIDPVKHGGTNNILNLVTSCFDCNAGKGATPLSDKSTMEKQRKQLELLQERKEQMEMMFEWQKELFNLDDQETDRIAGYWAEKTGTPGLNDYGMREIRKHKRKFGFQRVMMAINIVVDQYCDFNEDSTITRDSLCLAFSKIGGVCFCEEEKVKNPEASEIRVLVYNLERKFDGCYFNKGWALSLLRNANRSGLSPDELRQICFDCDNWAEFRECMESIIGSAK
jgi:hypothetical protein